MRRIIDLPDPEPRALGDCIAAIDAAGFDADDEESLQHTAHWLARLGANRTFLADLLVEQLKARHRDTDGATAYGAQVIMLSPGERDVFLRANIWPSRDEHMMQASGAGAFVYDLPHDHNFDFLTVGYLGPGYWSDYYKYDFDAVDGWQGEDAQLRFVERARLNEGKVMHYRAHRDIHCQIPPDAISVSVNVLKMRADQGWKDQYRFDFDKGTIEGTLNPRGTTAFLRVATGLASDEALDLTENFARHHPSGRIRLSAWEGLARAGDAAAVWARAEGSGSRLVAMEAKRRLCELAA